MDSTLLLALVGFGSAVSGGILQAFASRLFERHRFFRDNKREVYGDFLSALADLSMYPSSSPQNTDAKARVAETRCKIALYGSPSVIRTVGDVFDHDQLLKPEAQLALSKAVEAMRQDTGLKVSVGVSHDLQKLLFNTKSNGVIRWT